MESSTRKSLAITLAFSVFTLITAIVYWFAASLASWGGPEDDIAIVYILAAPMLLHGFLVARHGWRNALLSSLLLYGFIAILCVARHTEISNRIGYSDWHAKRSLEALLWSVPWFLTALGFVFVRKKPETKNEERGTKNQGRAASPPTTDS